MDGLCLVTGAYEGIGRALMNRLAPSTHVIALDQNPKIHEHRSSRVEPECLNLFSTSVGKQLANIVGDRPLSLLIHNAGAASFGLPWEEEDFRRVVRVNLEAPIEITRALYPNLLGAGGKVVFISSSMTSIACPRYASYMATKSGLEAFARSLRSEWKGKVGVQVICPPPTRTRFHSKIGMNLGKIGWDRFESPDRVASRIVRAVKTSRGFVDLSLSGKAMRLASRFFPRALDSVVGRAMQ